MLFNRYIRLVAAIGFIATFVCFDENAFAGAVEELTAVNQQFNAAYRRGDHKRALAYAATALRLSAQMFGDEHQITIQWFDAVGGLSSMTGDYQTAIATYQRAEKALTKVFGPESRQLLINLNSLAAAHAALGHAAEAEAIYGRLLRMAEATLRANDRDVGFVAMRVADFYASSGRYAEAEPLYQRALTVFKTTVGADHLDTVGVMNALAEAYRNMGDYAKAESLCRRALEVAQKNPEGERQVATLLSCLGAVYFGAGDFAKAETFFQQALKASEKLYGAQNREVAAGLNNLAALYSSMDANAKAEPLAERAMQLTEKLFGPDRSETLNTKQNLAGIYLRTGRNTDAINLLHRVLDANELLLGPVHPANALALEGLAILHHERRDFTNAEAFYRRAIEMDERIFGRSHRQTITATSNLSALLQDMGKREDAVTLAAKVGTAQSEEFSNILSFAAERQRLAYRATHDAYSLVASMGAAPEVTLAILRNKCVVLDSLLEDRRVAGSLTNADDQMLIDKIQNAKQRLNEQFVFSPEIYNRKTSQTEAVELRRRLADQIEQLEGRLARQVSGLGNARQALRVSTEQVQKTIPTNAALIEFVRYWHYLGFRKAEHRYGAAIVTPCGEPKWVCLGAANAIEKNISLYQDLVRGEVEDVDDSVLSRTLRQLHQQVWSPVERALPSGTKTIVLSPDDQLNFVSFATLLGEDGQFLAQKYSLRYVTSGRDLLRTVKKSASADMLIFAAPTYSAKTPTKQQSSGLYLEPLPELATNAAVLEAKAKEWKWPVQVYVGANATEQRVHDVQAPRILHLSTHGFFLPEIIGSVGQTPYSNPLPFQPKASGVVLMNPMRRSGVALAGAQETLDAWHRGQVPPARNDGILTAEEVCGMRLDGTWLVTLAVCDTGFGISVAGESVMGLRRGFMQAGAQNLLMTLWRVAVNETDDFLLDFYSAAHESGDAPGALAKVQREWLKKIRARRGLFPAVFFAGPFVLNAQGSL